MTVVMERVAFLQGFERVPLSKEEKAIQLGQSKWPTELGLDVVQIAKIAEYMVPYEARPAITIFRKGDLESFMCLIMSGGAQIYTSEAKKRDDLIATLGPENTIGEMGLIDGQPRSAYAYTSATTRIFVMTKSNFMRLKEDHPDIWGNLIFWIATLMSDRLRKANLSVERLNRLKF